jgi:hypothetical protein
MTNNPVLVAPALGTPVSGNLSNCTGFPAASLGGLGAGVATWLATPSSANLAAAVTGETGSGALVFATSPALVTPALGDATATSLTATGLIASSGLAGIGYSAGAGGSVTQVTSKSTGVTLNKICGRILTSNAQLNSTAAVGFTLTNSTIAATDIVYVCVAAGEATLASYRVQVDAIAAGSCRISIWNHSPTNLSEQLTIYFIVLKMVIA